MGTLASNVGLVSGMDIGNIVSQLMSIERRPVSRLETRITNLTAKQTGLLGIQAVALSVKLAATGFNKDATFQQKAINSSNEDVLGVTATRFAVPTSQSFRVKRLATNHVTASQPFMSRTAKAGAGTLSFEVGEGQVGKGTDLKFLNGQRGIDRSELVIQDKNGNDATIDISMAISVDEIINAINDHDDINVNAKVSGDKIVITDTTSTVNAGNVAGGGKLIISGASADSLGISTVSGGVDSEQVGANILSITNQTLISELNDGNGVRFFKGGTSHSADADLQISQRNGNILDIEIEKMMVNTTRLSGLNSGGGVRLGAFRITDQNGHSADIDLTEMQSVIDGEEPTLAEMKTFILDIVGEGGSAGMNIALTGVTQGDHLTLVDNSDGSTDEDTGDRRSHFIIEDLNGGFAAEDLGIAQDRKGGTITGDEIYQMETLGDIISAINNHHENDGTLVASINSSGTGLKVEDNSVQIGESEFAITSENGVGYDLGLVHQGIDYVDGMTSVDGKRLIAGLNTVLLRSINGGTGKQSEMTGIGENDTILLEDENGAFNTNIFPQELILRDSLQIETSTLDLSDAETLQDIIDALNSAANATLIRGRVNNAGNGIELYEDNDTPGASSMYVGGDFAKYLGVELSDGISTTVDSGSLQLQYVSEASQLADLNYGRGVETGSFTLAGSAGGKREIAVSTNDTLADVLDKINDTSQYSAEINETGDGIIVSTLDGSPLTITELDAGRTAHDLGILGSSKGDEDFIDGSYELSLDIGGGDNLEDIVSRVNKADIGIRASVVGNDENNYRITFNSEIEGRVGRIYMDTGTTDLGAQGNSSGITLVEGDDALVEQNGTLLRSSSNTVENVIKGVTLELHKVSDELIQVSVEHDLEGIKAQMEAFVNAYNGAMDRIAEATSFNPETLEKGVLFGDQTVNQIERALKTMIQRIVPGVSPNYNRLSAIGITVTRGTTETTTDADGEVTSFAVSGVQHLQFDASILEAAYADNPLAVEALFTEKNIGIGDHYEEEIERIAGSNDGLVKTRVDAIRQRSDVFKDRIEYLNALILRKEDRLYKDFYAMEEALSGLQTQSSSLSALQNIPQINNN